MSCAAAALVSGENAVWVGVFLELVEEYCAGGARDFTWIVFGVKAVGTDGLRTRILLRHLDKSFLVQWPQPSDIRPASPRVNREYSGHPYSCLIEALIAQRPQDPQDT